MSSTGQIILFLLGWPAVVSGVLVSSIGIYFNKVKLILLAAAMITPFCLYFIGANNWMAAMYPLMPFCLIGSWYYAKRGINLKAWILTLLAAVAFLYLAFVLFISAQN